MNLNEHKKLMDIEWFDGPLLSLFKDKNGVLFLYKWVDVKENGHTWLVFETTQEMLIAYVQQVISEKALILLSPDKRWYLVDISSALAFSNLRPLDSEKLKAQALPKDHVYFDSSDCPDPVALSNFIHQELIAA